MRRQWTAAELIGFTDRVASAFNSGRIRAPVHLNSDSQAEHLIRIFSDVQDHDWVFSTWRSSWHCLLKGVPEEESFQAILDGRSMTYCSKEHRIICSSIVGGHLPVAAGVAMGIKLLCGHEKVWVFVGDSAARTGIYSEFVDFVSGHSLPVSIVQEDNGYSTDTPTNAAWGDESQGMLNYFHYEYERNRPHVGTGEYVTF